MSRSCPLVPGSLIPFYPLIQTMSHSNREEGEEGGCWEKQVQDGEKRRHDKSWWDSLVWRSGGWGSERQETLIRSTVLRASPHYRKTELRFTIYASSATVYGRNMKRNMTRKTNSSWRQTKDKVQTLVRLRHASLQTPGTSTQPISCSSPVICSVLIMPINYPAHSPSTGVTGFSTTLMREVHEKSTLFLLYFAQRPIFVNFTPLPFPTLTLFDRVGLCEIDSQCFVPSIFYIYPVALSRSRCRMRWELARCPCAHCCSSWVPPGEE